MRNKFLILLFGLLLAVGWTNDASAQALPALKMSVQYARAAKIDTHQHECEFGAVSSETKSMYLREQKSTASYHDAPLKFRKTPKVLNQDPSLNSPRRANENSERPDVVKPKSYYDALEYTWTDANGPHTSKATDYATKPEQMYELLRFVYMNPAFPGPYYSGYDANGNRERKVYYGGVEGGWNIPGNVISGSTTTTGPVGNITITMDNGNYSFQTIQVKSGNTVLTEWSYAENTTNLPNSNWSTTSAFIGESTNSCYMSGGGTITINSSLLQGATNVTVEIYGRHDPDYNSDVTVTVAGSTGTSSSQTFTKANDSNWSLSSWTVNGATTTTTHGVLNAIPNISISGTNQYAMINSIKVLSGNTTLFSWDYDINGTASSTSTGFWPLGMNYSSWGDYSGYGIAFNDDLEAIVLDSWLFAGYSSVTVSIEAANSQSEYAASLIVNGTPNNITSTYQQQQGTMETKTWTINADTYNYNEYETDTYIPDEEGYTVLVVKLKNDLTLEPDDPNYSMSSFFDSKQQIIDYFTNNVDSIKLLTDGLRIGTGEDVGTVFNCDGIYNRFFFLSKGQARQKADIVNIRETTGGHLLGEAVPFKFMYEEFSPTGGQAGADITDFYSTMMDGHVYNVVHDCASVIQNQHEFSMSGHDGRTSYSLTGLNFFIPDYRLKYWVNENHYDSTAIDVDDEGNLIWRKTGPYSVDGRIMNPYQEITLSSNPATNPAAAFTVPSNWAAWYAQYHLQHAPKIGIYKITLEANAVSNGTYGEGNTFNVTLDWVSSLNEMSNSIVPQTYYLYAVTVDEQGNETIADEPFAVIDTQTTNTFPVPQQEESYTLTYIVMGTPRDSEHPSFIAWSNSATVVIPGYDDFMKLELEHYESDFVVGNVDRGEKNYYRNFLLLSNINDDNALTTSSIDLGKDEFLLQRYDYYDPDKVKTDVATIHLSLNNDGKYVDCTVDYNEANDDINEPEDNPTKYHRSTMHMQETTQDVGTLSVTGNGDIVITPSGYEVNFTSIKVTADGTTTTWNVADGDLPNGWHLSPSTWWTSYQGAYYLDGGGYIYIPTNNATAARVEITAYGDGTSLAKVDVNGVPKTFANGAANAETKSWTVNTVGSTGNKAPRQAGDRSTSTVTFTAGTDVGNTQNQAADKIGKLNVGIKSTSAGLGYNPYRFYAGTITITARDGGRITNVVINGSSTSYPVSRLSGSGYSYSGNTGTWTGNAQSVTLTASSQVRVSSIVVTHESDDPVDPAEGTIIWDFEEQSDFNDFTIIDSDNDGFNWSWDNTGSISHSGTGVVQSASYDNSSNSALTPNNWMISPEVDLGGTLTLWACGQDDDWAEEKFGVFVCVGSYDGVSDFQQVGPTVTATGIMTQYTFDLSQFQGKGHFAIRHFDVTDNFILNIDDIMITGQGGGETPEPETAGMVRMRLPMVDEFSALTADNDHPRRYAYVLTYAPGTPDEESTNTVEVPVLHTDAVMHGFYTLDEINGDTKRNLDMNVLNAEVELELANLSSPYYYTINRKTNARPNVETGNRAVLQHRDDNWYQEMRDSSPRYRNEYEPGSTYKCLDTEGIVCGDEIGYNDFMSYVPVVWTKGFDRRYYDEDERHNPNTAHNSYGASVFKTGAGQVVIGQSSLKAEKQIGQTGHWTEGEDNVNLYILSVDQVKGVLPTVSTVEYEPYMFRVFVESPNEKLRGFKFFEGTQDSPAHFEPDPDFTINDRKGPWCVWTEYLTGDYTDLTEIDFTKLKDETNWENNIRFAGLSDIIVDENTPIADGDLKIYVRFYYVVKGFKPQPNSLRAGGGDGGPAGYGSEGSAKPDPFVGINELHDGIVPVDVTYVNPQGMKSSRPFDGVNIVVTRYSDGSTRTTKIIR